MNANKKMGRPFEENPKNTKITIRVTKDEKEKLDKYCKENNLSISEVFREYLKKLK